MNERRAPRNNKLLINPLSLILLINDIRFRNHSVPMTGIKNNITYIR
jgi:hypothetical protein